MDKKINELDYLPTLTGEEELPLVKDGQNLKMSLQTILTGNPSGTKIAIGTEKVENTRDEEKLLSTEQQAALDNKLDLTDLTNADPVVPEFDETTVDVQSGMTAVATANIKSTRGYNINGCSIQVQYMDPALDTEWTMGDSKPVVNGVLSYDFVVSGLSLTTTYNVRFVLTDVNNPGLNVVSETKQFITLDTYSTYNQSLVVSGADFTPANVNTTEGKFVGNETTLTLRGTTGEAYLAEVEQLADTGDFIDAVPFAMFRFYGDRIPVQGSDTNTIVTYCARGINNGDNLTVNENGNGMTRTVASVGDSTEARLIDRPWVLNFCKDLEVVNFGIEAIDQKTVDISAAVPAGSSWVSQSFSTPEAVYNVVSVKGTHFTLDGATDTLMSADGSTAVEALDGQPTVGFFDLSGETVTKNTSYQIAVQGISDDGTLVIGHQYDSSAGVTNTVIYEKVTGAWQLKQTIAATKWTVYQRIIFSQDNTMFAFVDNSGPNNLVIYRESGGVFSQVASGPGLNLTGSISATPDFSTFACGNINHNTEAGRVVVFHFSNDTITQVGQLQTSDAANYDRFGHIVKISPDAGTIIANLKYDDPRVYVFHNGTPGVGLWTDLTVADTTTVTNETVTLSTPATGFDSVSDIAFTPDSSTAVFTGYSSGQAASQEFALFTNTGSDLTYDTTLTPTAPSWSKDMFGLCVSNTSILDSGIYYYNDAGTWTEVYVPDTSDFFMTAFGADGAIGGTIKSFSVPYLLGKFRTMQIKDKLYFYGVTESVTSNNPTSNVYSATINQAGLVTSIALDNLTLPDPGYPINQMFVANNILHCYFAEEYNGAMYYAPIASDGTIGTFTRITSWDSVGCTYEEFAEFIETDGGAYTLYGRVLCEFDSNGVLQYDGYASRLGLYNNGKTYRPVMANGDDIIYAQVSFTGAETRTYTYEKIKTRAGDELACGLVALLDNCDAWYFNDKALYLFTFNDTNGWQIDIKSVAFDGFKAPIDAESTLTEITTTTAMTAVPSNFVKGIPEIEMYNSPDSQSVSEVVTAQDGLTDIYQADIETDMVQLHDYCIASGGVPAG